MIAISRLPKETPAWATIVALVVPPALGLGTWAVSETEAWFRTYVAPLGLCLAVLAIFACGKGHIELMARARAQLRADRTVTAHRDVLEQLSLLIAADIERRRMEPIVHDYMRDQLRKPQFSLQYQATVYIESRRGDTSNEFADAAQEVVDYFAAMRRQLASGIVSPQMSGATLEERRAKVYSAIPRDLLPLVASGVAKKQNT